MNFRTAKNGGLSAILLATLAACGSSGGSGAMTVKLVDASGPYSAVNLDIQKVEIHSDATGWLTLGTPNKTINLLSLTGGVAETLANGATLPAGTYSQMRLVLGSDNTVLPAGATTLVPLKVPSGLQSGVKLNVSFQVEPNTTKDVFIDFDANRSIFVHIAGSSGQYILRPVVRAVDELVTGAVTGKLVDSVTKAGLPGVVVTGQTVDASGTPSVVRTVQTAPDGTYTLDLLPVGGTYYVVSQPVVAGGSAYAAQSSGPIPVSAANPTPIYDFPGFVAIAPSQLGGVSGNITPIATTADADVVSVEQSLEVGSGISQALIVRASPATVGATAETYGFDSLPAGGYAAFVTRRTLDNLGNETVASSTPVPVTVPAGGTVVQDLIAP